MVHQGHKYPTGHKGPVGLAACPLGTWALWVNLGFGFLRRSTDYDPLVVRPMDYETLRFNRRQQTTTIKSDIYTLRLTADSAFW